MSSDQYLKQWEKYETYYSKILFYNLQIYTDLTSLMILSDIRENAVIGKQGKKKKKLSFPGPRTFTKI